MSDLPPAPASATDETAPDDVAERSSAGRETQSRDAGSDARSDDDSGFRTATRLLRLLKLALGVLVSFLTALKLLGVL